MSISADLTLLRDLATTPGRRAAWLGIADDLSASAVRDPDGIAHVTGDLERFVVNFVEASPLPESARFVPPTDAERASAIAAWDLLASGDATAAAELLGPLGLRILRFTDTGGAQTTVHNMIVELPRGGDGQVRGLGMFVQRSDANRGAVHVQVPHPKDDAATDVLGVNTYRQAEGSMLAIAGASRFAVPDKVSDAAHSRVTLFHALTDHTAGPGTRHVQIHGFNQARHPGYGEAVVSTGAAPSPSASRVRAALEDADIDARLAGSDRPYKDLAGTKNVQGTDARAKGADWVHVEFSDRLRIEPGHRRDIVAALVDGLRAPTTTASAVGA